MLLQKPIHFESDLCSTKGSGNFASLDLGIPKDRIKSIMHSIHTFKLILKVLSSSSFYNYFVSKIVLTENFVHYDLNIMKGMPIKMNKNGASWRDEASGF